MVSLRNSYMLFHENCSGLLAICNAVALYQTESAPSCRKQSGHIPPCFGCRCFGEGQATQGTVFGVSVLGLERFPGPSPLSPTNCIQITHQSRFAGTHSLLEKTAIEHNLNKLRSFRECMGFKSYFWSVCSVQGKGKQLNKVSRKPQDIPVNKFLFFIGSFFSQDMVYTYSRNFLKVLLPQGYLSKLLAVFAQGCLEPFCQSPILSQFICKTLP